MPQQPNVSALISDAVASFARDAAKRDLFSHNLTYFLQTHAARRIASEQPVAFDFRADYWHKQEVRVLLRFFEDSFTNEFYPPTTLRKIIFTIAQFAKAKRAAGDFDGLSKLGMIESAEVFRRDIRIMRKVFAEAKLELPTLGNGPMASALREGTPLLQQLDETLATLAKHGKWQEMDTSFLPRVRYLHYFTAQHEKELYPHARFFGAWYTMLTSSNAYQHGASRQNMGPIYGNIKTLDMLNYMNRWSSGESMADLPLMAYGSSSDDLIDRSRYMATLELYGFCQLDKIPIINSGVIQQYRDRIKLSTENSMVLQQQLGDAFSRVGRDDPACAFAQKSWSEHLEDAIIAIQPTIWQERISAKKVAEPFQQELFLTRLTAELQQ